MLSNKKRLIYFMLIISMMIIIFLFSSQASENSNYLSYTLSDKVYQKIENTEGENKTNIVQENIKDNNTNTNINNKFPTDNKIFRKINEIIRKSAHIFLYMMLGIFIILFIKTYNISTKKAVLITISICFIYACLDEFNQYLRGTRTALFTDSLIDTCGCILGCLIIEIKKE